MVYTWLQNICILLLLSPQMFLYRNNISVFKGALLDWALVTLEAM